MEQTLSLKKRRARSLVVAGLVAGGAFVLPMIFGGLPSAPAGTNPPGNNGTVKIDDVAFDDHPDNEPHVGCVFQVDFYGFDAGDLDAAVTFTAHPPTGPPVVLLTDTVFIGEDDNSGGGSEAGLDASETYTLDLTGITPHPQQGWHVKLLINAEGSQGADTKFKVFWVSGCVPPTTTTSTTSTTEPPTSSSTTEPPTSSSTTEPPTSSSTTEPPTSSSTTEPPTSSSSTSMTSTT